MALAHCVICQYGLDTITDNSDWKRVCAIVNACKEVSRTRTFCSWAAKNYDKQIAAAPEEEIRTIRRYILG